MSKNMEDFDKGVALIAEKLYEAFPKRILVDITELEEGATEGQLHNYGEALYYLSQEGFIRCGDISYDDGNTITFAINAQLTSKGLAVLKTMPDTLKDNKKIIDIVKEGLMKDSQDLISKSVTDIVTFGMKILQMAN